MPGSDGDGVVEDGDETEHQGGMGDGRGGCKQEILPQVVWDREPRETGPWNGRKEKSRKG